MVRRATVGSASNGTAPQGKVARKSPRSRRQEVSRASGYNLASSVFGSLRGRGDSPDGDTPKLYRMPRRAESAEGRDGESGTPGVGASAPERTKGTRNCKGKNEKEGTEGRVPQGRSCRKAERPDEKRISRCHTSEFRVSTKIRSHGTDCCVPEAARAFLPSVAEPTSRKGIPQRAKGGPFVKRRSERPKTDRSLFRRPYEDVVFLSRIDPCRQREPGQ